MTPVDIIKGDDPVILAMPHTGLYVPDEIHARFSAIGRDLADTDWHIDELYAGLLPGATMVRANFHRYVIDPNRDPSGASLYPGQNTTGLCPLTDFDAKPLYKKGKAPSVKEIEQRRLTFHAPYHAALTAEIARVKALHGIAVLYDCHSIRSHVPYLFEGRLPDFNIGTNGGVTCAPEIEAIVTDKCKSAKGYTHVVNGRFKGGWTTRHYGQPKTGVHAIQMELSQINYMHQDSPYAYAPERAERLRKPIKSILQSIETLILKGGIS